MAGHAETRGREGIAGVPSDATELFFSFLVVQIRMYAVLLIVVVNTKAFSFFKSNRPLLPAQPACSAQ